MWKLENLFLPYARGQSLCLVSSFYINRWADSQEEDPLARLDSKTHSLITLLTVSANRCHLSRWTFKHPLNRHKWLQMRNIRSVWSDRESPRNQCYLFVGLDALNKTKPVPFKWHWWASVNILAGCTWLQRVYNPFCVRNYHTYHSVYATFETQVQF